MSKHEVIAANEFRIPLEALTLSEMNPRQSVPDEEVVELAGSLMAAGLLHNLVGLGDENAAEIVAGGRRLRALKYLAEQHDDLSQTRPDLAFPLVKVTLEPQTALLWASTENNARKDMSPAQEIISFAKMDAAGFSAAQIARSFTKTEKHVYRRLALSKLPEAVIQSLDAGEINLSAAGCFTISDDAERSLEVLETIKGNNFSDHRIKEMLKPNAVRGSNRKAIFVGVEAYKAAGGIVGGDLFSTEVLFENPEILDDCFDKALAELAAEMQKTHGWKWVDTFDGSWTYQYNEPLNAYEKIYPQKGALTEEQAERYEGLEELAEAEVLDKAGTIELEALQAILDGGFTEDQKKHAGALVYINDSGKLVIEAAYVKPEDHDEAAQAGVVRKVASTSKIKSEKPEFSQKFIDDMKAVRLAATQTALLRKPEYLLDLFGFDVSAASDRLSSIFAHGFHEAEPNCPTIDDNFSLDSRLGGERDGEAEALYELLNGMAENGPVKAFNAFREAGKKLRNGQMTAYLAKRFQTQRQEFMALIMEEAGADMREIWTPSETNCFKRLNGGQLDGIFADLMDLKADSQAQKVFLKLKKGQKANTLHKLFNDAEYQEKSGVTAEQKARIDAWFPACFG